jgi:hypothetical protein
MILMSARVTLAGLLNPRSRPPTTDHHSTMMLIELVQQDWQHQAV